LEDKLGLFLSRFFLALIKIAQMEVHQNSIWVFAAPWTNGAMEGGCKNSGAGKGTPITAPLGQSKGS